MSKGNHGYEIETSECEFIKDGSGEELVDIPFDDLHKTYEGALRHRDYDFSFGGHWHSLQIVPFQPPQWILKPLWGTLGVPELLDPRDISGISLSASSAREEIICQMKRMKKSLFARALTEEGKHPCTIPDCIKYWERGRAVKNPPDWMKIYRLVAIGDEAKNADPTDVSEEDALLYIVHVEELIKSLPSTLTP